MAKDLKYGMVGGSIYAFIGEVHRKAIHFDTRAELVCGCFSNIPSENEDTAKAYGIDPARTYADYRKMARVEAARRMALTLSPSAPPISSTMRLPRSSFWPASTWYAKSPCVSPWRRRRSWRRWLPPRTWSLP